MHNWWEKHKRIFMYPRDWGNSMSRFLRFVYKYHRLGILIITENPDMKTKVVRILGSKDIQVGGVCSGDMVLYDTPISSMLNDEVLWWDAPDVFMGEEEFIKTYSQ